MPQSTRDLLDAIRHNEGDFPRNELEQLIASKEEASPLLLDIVDESIERPQAYLEDESRIDLLYALYLLSQFRDIRLFPRLIRLLSLPADILDGLLGDCLTEGTGRMLATVFDGDVRALQRLIEQVGPDEFARGQGLQALSILVLNGQLERQWYVGYLQELLERCFEDDPLFNAQVVSSCADMHPEETYGQIKRAFERNAIDTMMVDLEYVDGIRRETPQSVWDRTRKNPHFQFITDTIEELHWWACFQPQPSARPSLQESRTFEKAWQAVAAAKETPVVRAVKIGRNEPCPCGSGKKYKKCCGSVV